MISNKTKVNGNKIKDSHVVDGNCNLGKTGAENVAKLAIVFNSTTIMQKHAKEKFY